MTAVRTKARRASALGAGTLVVALVAALAGCGGGSAAAPVTVTPTATVTASAEATRVAAPEPAAQLVWPLTGVATEEVAQRPALSVKIENSSAARPQTGLEDADIVWETLVEGGITRFIATYHSTTPEEVGPIRSVRPMDPNILGSVGGLLAFSGGQAQFVNAVAPAGLQVVSMDRGNGGFYRVSGRSAPHNVMGTLATFWAQADADHSAVPAQQFSYARSAEDSAGAAGSAVATVAVTMSGGSHPRWEWDAASGTFLRSEGTTASYSADGDRLSATNVVLLSVEVVQTSSLDPAGNPVPDTIVVGSGAAVVASAGGTVAGTWSKESTSAPFVLTADDGTTIELAPGRTWVELVPTSGGWTLG